jgi:hypothetical protein
MNSKIEDILLEEIRLNRKAIAKLDAKFSDKLVALDKQVFSNKIKLGIFIAGITIFFNIIVIVLADKLKSLIL